MPDCCIGVDVIVGFPGETETLFQETYTLLNELDISYLHVFTYSERENTPASEMENPVDKGVRNQRSKMLRILSAKKKRAFYEQNIGSSRTVLFEHDNKGGYIQGFTENYIKVKTFGLFIALAFLTGSYFISKDLTQKNKSGLIPSNLKTVIKGRPTNIVDVIRKALVGLLIGFKAHYAYQNYEIFNQDTFSFLFSCYRTYLCLLYT